MAKFKFKLQNFLSLKEKIEDQKKMEYAEATKILEDEKKKKADLQEKKNNLVIQFREEMKNQFNSTFFELYNNYIKRVKEEIIEQEEVVKQAAKNVEKKRKILIEAVKERKALDILKEKKLEEFIKEEKQAEQKSIDELVSYKYN